VKAFKAGFLVALGVAGFTAGSPALAALGGDISSIEGDRVSMKGALTAFTTVKGYSVHEITTAAGVHVREYLTSDGKVMAVDITTSPSFQAGVPRLLFQGPPLLFPFGVSKPSQWGVAADGKRFLFQVPLASNPQSQLTILLNWQAALKK